MSLSVVTPPAEEPISLVNAKLHLRVDLADDDSYIQSLIIAARRWCEGYRRQAFVTTQFTLTLDNWPEDWSISLPRSPLQSVQAVDYFDDAGTEYEMPPADYLVDGSREPGRIVLLRDSWPAVPLQRAAAVRITFTAGYGEADDVPEEIQAAIRLLVGDLYENREDTLVAQGVNIMSVPNGVKALLGMDRVFSF